jgi:hypothetical protein
MESKMLAFSLSQHFHGNQTERAFPQKKTNYVKINLLRVFDAERATLTETSAVDCDVPTGYRFGTGSGPQNFLLQSHLIDLCRCGSLLITRSSVLNTSRQAAETFL